jgi:hypothetical protein
VVDRLGVGDLDLVERLLEDCTDPRADHRMVVDDQAARRVLRAGGHWAQYTSNCPGVPNTESPTRRPPCGDGGAGTGCRATGEAAAAGFPASRHRPRGRRWRQP